MVHEIIMWLETKVWTLLGTLFPNWVCLADVKGVEESYTYERGDPAPAR